MGPIKFLYNSKICGNKHYSSVVSQEMKAEAPFIRHFTTRRPMETLPFWKSIVTADNSTLRIAYMFILVFWQLR